MSGERKNSKLTIAGCGLLMALTSCNGVFDDLYDDIPPAPAVEEQRVDDKGQISGEIYIDASSWTKWHYIDFHALGEAVKKGDFDIPLDEADDSDSNGTGIYTYWYDVFGEGLSRHELRSYYPTVPQPEPDSWDLAVHRNNVRTNGGSVYQTTLTDISQVGTADTYASMPFVPDAWNETDVWTVQEHMLLGLIGNQRIKINSELGKWLHVDLPPIPPAFTHNDRVFIVRFSDSTCAALRLKGYIGPDNVKCHLTIEYKYPL